MGNIQFTANGLLFTANGVAMDPACCCGGGCTPDCPYCTECPTPSQLSVTFSGITVGSCCCNVGVQCAYLTNLSFDPNDTFTVDYFGSNSCLWTYTASATGKLRVFDESDTNCEGTYTEYDVTQINISVTSTVGGDLVVSFIVFVGGTGYYLFYGTETISGSCFPSGTISNDYSDCASSGVAGYGGTATVETV